MDNTILIKIIQIIPDILWIILSFIIFIFLYKMLKNQILPHMKYISAYGVEIHLLKTTINSIIEVAEKHNLWKVKISEEEKMNVINRAKSHYKLFNNVNILWFDDRPYTLINEIKMFSQLGINIQVVDSLDKTLSYLRTKKYDILISDIDRKNNKNGVETLKEIYKNGYEIPTIFYIGIYLKELGVPPFAFGITNRPDELLHLVLDILERKKHIQIN